MKRLFVPFLSLYFTSMIYPSITLIFDPSEPPRYEINSIVRKVDNITIDIYYKTPKIERTYLSTITYKNGSFTPDSISIDIQSLDDTFFYAVYHLNNNYTEISGYTSKIPQNQLTALENLGRVVGLKLSSSKDKFMFPVTKPQGNFINLHLAMNAYYILTCYLSTDPINSFFNEDGKVFVGLEHILTTDRCSYDKRYRKIKVGSSMECSYYDSTYKHEYGHHLTHSVFKIPYTKYNPKYELFEPCDEQTALNEGFSVFLESRGTFSGLNDDFHNYYGINAGNDGANLYEKYKTDVRSSLLLRSGESVIGNISIALMQIDPTKNMKTKNFENLL